MSCRKGKQRKNSGEDGSSVFLGLLPVAYDLEAPKQNRIFEMLGAKKIIEKEHARTVKEFRLHVTKARRKGLNWREKNFRNAFNRRIFALVDAADELDTQKIRAEAVKTINCLIEEALAHGKGKDLSHQTRIEWFRITGYLFQVLKSIMREHDQLSIKEDLKRLKLKVNNELRKRNKKAKRRS